MGSDKGENPHDFDVVKISGTGDEAKSLVTPEQNFKNGFSKAILTFLNWNFWLTWAVILFQIVSYVFKLPHLPSADFGAVLAASALTQIAQPVLKHFFPEKH